MENSVRQKVEVQITLTLGDGKHSRLVGESPNHFDPGWQKPV